MDTEEGARVAFLRDALDTQTQEHYLLLTGDRIDDFAGPALRLVIERSGR
ncbi:hypothetical protein SDC9_202055 [bioreactor metagenome]|uniref:Uncharacterized protein n=1 Tax=bioreactor metagenome TaxID=1076179 RepID=A0A645ISL6_9ZZZZ